MLHHVQFFVAEIKSAGDAIGKHRPVAGDAAEISVTGLLPVTIKAIVTGRGVGIVDFAQVGVTRIDGARDGVIGIKDVAILAAQHRRTPLSAITRVTIGARIVIREVRQNTVHFIAGINGAVDTV